MKRLIHNRYSGYLKILISFSLVSLVACSTEIDLFLPGDPIPVVYCLLNPDSSVQYVRVGQTYTIPIDQPGYIPGREELIIDEEIEVYLAAERTDLKQDIYFGTLINPFPKDSGMYPREANQVYQIKCNILPDCSYSLYIHFIETNRVVYGQTRSFGNGFTIIDPEKVPGRSINLFSDKDFYVRFRPVTNGSIYQSTMTFRYLDIMDGVRTERSMVLPQDFVTETDTGLMFIDQRISGERFIIDVSRNVLPAEGIRRIPLGFDFHITCGGDDLSIKINAENNTQSFSVMEVNSFDNAFGVFSCMSHRHVDDFPLSRYTIDTLAKGPLTRNLGFLTAREIDSLSYENIH
ncbi:MAG: hypothetical protein V2A67_04540 [Bacteroidota bacterium]